MYRVSNFDETMKNHICYPDIYDNIYWCGDFPPVYYSFNDVSSFVAKPPLIKIGKLSLEQVSTASK